MFEYWALWWNERTLCHNDTYPIAISLDILNSCNQSSMINHPWNCSLWGRVRLGRAQCNTTHFLVPRLLAGLLGRQAAVRLVPGGSGGIRVGVEREKERGWAWGSALQMGSQSSPSRFWQLFEAISMLRCSDCLGRGQGQLPKAIAGCQSGESLIAWICSFWICLYFPRWWR